MTNLTPKNILATLAVSTAALATSFAGHAQTYSSAGYQYNECKKADKDNQLIGGVLGAIAGGVIGSQVAGRGDRTEGSVLGAVIGGAAGAGIGDDNRNCRKEVARTQDAYTSRTYGSTYGTTGYSRTQPTHGTVYTYPTTTRVVTTTGHNSGYNRGRTYGQQTVHYPAPRVNRVENIKFKIEQLRAERDQLKERRRYAYAPWIDRRIHAIGQEIDVLKDRKKRVKNRQNNRRYYN